MLTNILRNVHVYTEWVAKKYTRHCKSGAWKPQNTVESMKCYNLERIIEANTFGTKCPKELDMGEYLQGFDDV